MTTASADDLLPDGWLAALSATGHFAYALAQRAGGPDRVTDALLLRVAARLAALAPGLSCGAVMPIREEPGTRYAALTRGPVPFHNDHLYFYKPTQYLLFYCDEPAGEGGETLVVRGDEAARRLRPGLRDLLSQLRVRVRQGDCCVARTLLAAHPLDGVPVLLFSDTLHGSNCALEVDGRPLDPAIVDEVRALLDSIPPHCQRWRRGDLLLLDNFRCLHARTAYSGRRSLRRVSVGPHASRS